MIVKQGFGYLVVVVKRGCTAFWKTVGKIREYVSVPQNTLKNILHEYVAGGWC